MFSRNSIDPLLRDAVLSAHINSDNVSRYKPYYRKEKLY